MAMLKNTRFALWFVTIFLLVYTVGASMGMSPTVVTVMFLLSPFLVLWLVYTVLRFGTPSGRTFDEYFYDDTDIRADQPRKGKDKSTRSNS
jgi:membrane protein implicated in regulation of membrane protease activity